MSRAREAAEGLRRMNTSRLRIGLLDEQPEADAAITAALTVLDAQAEAEGSNEPLSAMMAEEAIAEARFESAMRDEARLDPRLSTDATEAELRGTIATLKRLVESQRKEIIRLNAATSAIAEERDSLVRKGKENG